MATAQQNYLNPITLEAKLFALSLNSLGERYNTLDYQLVEALENVMKSIEKFIDKNESNEIVDTKRTQLAKCNDLQHLQRIFHCSYCKKDLGKDITKVTLHYAEDCASNQVQQTTAATEAVAPKEAAVINPGRDDTKKLSRRAERREKREGTKEQLTLQRLNAAVKLNKKTKAFLTMDQPSLYKFLSDFVQIGEKLKCLPDYELIKEDIMDLIKPQYPKELIKIYYFGSRMTGIGTRESDLDMYIDVGSRFHIFENRPTKEFMEPLYKLRDAMNSHRKTWRGMVLVDGARVPILKIIHSKTGIECDINLTNSLGHINSQFLEYLFSLQPVVLLMCIYMKKWLSRINMKSDFSTYSMTLMVIFFLQQRKFLPPLSKFFENIEKDSALTVGPWLSSFARLTLKDLGLQKAEMSHLLEYIKCFFRFYVSFNYNANVICPYDGKVITKAKLNTIMPSHYKSYISEKPNVEIALNKPIVVQDPIELNNNVTKGLPEFGLAVFIEFMKRSLELIA